MIKKITITNIEEAKRVLEIQRSSYMAEAEWIGYYDIPPLKETLGALQKCGETFYGFYEKGELCGAISFKKENGIVDIHRLMVHPAHFRKRIGNRLLKFVEQVNKDAGAMIVSTGTKNIPAIKFYERNGFRRTGETRISEELSITHFMKGKEGQDGSVGR